MRESFAWGGLGLWRTTLASITVELWDNVKNNKGGFRRTYKRRRSAQLFKCRCSQPLCLGGGAVKHEPPGPRARSWAHRSPATPHRHWVVCSALSQTYCHRTCRLARLRLPPSLRPRQHPAPGLPPAAQCETPPARSARRRPTPLTRPQSGELRALDAFLAPQTHQARTAPRCPCSPAAGRGHPPRCHALRPAIRAGRPSLTDPPRRCRPQHVCVSVFHAEKSFAKQKEALRRAFCF